MVDAIDSKSVVSNGVRVQVPSPVNRKGQVCDLSFSVYSESVGT